MSCANQQNGKKLSVIARRHHFKQPSAADGEQYPPFQLGGTTSQLQLLPLLSPLITSLQRPLFP